MESLDRDIVDLLSRRAFDVAASTRGVKVFLNGKRLPVKDFKDYIELILKASRFNVIHSINIMKVLPKLFCNVTGYIIVCTTNKF